MEGRGTERKGRAEHSRAGQGKVRPGKAIQDRAGRGTAVSEAWYRAS